MKRYELMSKEEIMLVLNGWRGGCDHCPMAGDEYMCHNNTCLEDAVEYLNEELDLVPRVALINTKEELLEAIKQCREICNETTCDDCPGIIHCFVSYLAEEVERGEGYEES